MATIASTLFIDTETRNELDIKAVGTVRHAVSCIALMVTYAFEGGPVKLWDPRTELIPEDLATWLLDPDVILVAHNALYDMLVLEHALGIKVPLERWRDSMVLAYTMGLPGKLDTLAKALGLPEDQQKIKEGTRLIKMFSKPRRPSKANPAPYWEPDTKPEEWARFCAYARGDIVTMRECWRRIPDWVYRGVELDYWRMDIRINLRGIRIDTPAVEALLRAVAKETTLLDEEISQLTGGEIESGTQRDAMLGYAQRLGYEGDDLTKGAVADALETLPAGSKLRRVLEIRQRVSRTSTAKLAKMMGAAVGERLCGCFQFYGASRTGREAGRLVQLQNQPRGGLKPHEQEMAVEAALAGVLDILYEDPTYVASSCIRPVLVPSTGKRFVVSDLANIEGRMLAWLAGEQWKLDAFAAFDRGEGEDLYKLAYARSFGVQVEEIGSDERMVGKVQELALGYEGGVGAFDSFAQIYRVDVSAGFNQVWDLATEGQRIRAQEAYERDLKAKKFPVMSKETYLAADLIKQAWRRAHQATCRLWLNTSKAVKAAIKARDEGKVYRAGRVRWTCRQKWLLGILPSGRALAYYHPSLEGPRETIHFWGMVDLGTGGKKWMKTSTFGGRLVENITQAAARDVLFAAMARIDPTPFDIVGHVHDEVITELPLDSTLGIDDLNQLLATPPDWADGLPLAAAGYEGMRYRKG